MDRIMNILITGGNGYIAKSLTQALKNKYNVMSISRDNFDLANKESTDIFFRHRLFDVVIHCAVKGGSRLKQDEWSDMDINLKMYYNILDNSNHFNKLIHFGSGAELYASHTPYGLSKKVIKESIFEKNNFYNLRIFGVFDENETENRFIKSNINRYIRKESIIIHQNKTMDFFYMKDLIKLVEYYITNSNIPKEINCNYFKPYKLSDIANLINNLNDYKVPIKIENDNIQSSYSGDFKQLNLNYIELENAIKEVYINLLNT